MIVRIRDVAKLINNKQTNKVLDSTTYVTTENMLPNRGGVEFPVKKLPKNIKKINTYKKGDILISNIRPYFKKIWLADRDGSCSGDVLIFRSANKELLQEFLYLVLQTDNFFEYMTVTSKGTKMPRGDKEAISEFKFNLPNIEVQKDICQKLLLLERKIKLNKEINANLLAICLNKIEYKIKNNGFEFQKISKINVTISDHIANGSFKSLKENVNYSDTKDYALFLRNIDFKANLQSDLKYIDRSSYNFLSKSHLYGGEVVISNVADVGSVHRVPNMNVPMVIGNNQIFIKSSEKYLTDYLFIYFNSRYGQHMIKQITSGSAQQKFNKTDFRSLTIPIMPSSEVKIHVSPLLELRDALLAENAQLIKIKNLLLSKLLN